MAHPVAILFQEYLNVFQKIRYYSRYYYSMKENIRVRRKVTKYLLKHLSREELELTVKQKFVVEQTNDNQISFILKNSGKIEKKVVRKHAVKNGLNEVHIFSIE